MKTIKKIDVKSIALPARKRVAAEPAETSTL